MSINSIILTAVTPIISNVWADELPPEPQWPAAMFEVETIAEQTWVQGGGYDQHTVTIYILGLTKSEVIAKAKLISGALEQLPQHLEINESGSSEYEDNAQVYAHFIKHTLRLPRY